MGGCLPCVKSLIPTARHEAARLRQFGDEDDVVDPKVPRSCFGYGRLRVDLEDEVEPPPEPLVPGLLVWLWELELTEHVEAAQDWVYEMDFLSYSICLVDVLENLDDFADCLELNLQERTRLKLGAWDAAIAAAGVWLPDAQARHPGMFSMFEEAAAARRAAAEAEAEAEAQDESETGRFELFDAAELGELPVAVATTSTHLSSHPVQGRGHVEDIIGTSSNVEKPTSCPVSEQVQEKMEDASETGRFELFDAADLGELPVAAATTSTHFSSDPVQGRGQAEDIIGTSSNVEKPTICPVSEQVQENTEERSAVARALRVAPRRDYEKPWLVGPRARPAAAAEPRRVPTGNARRFHRKDAWPRGGRQRSVML